MTPPVLAALTPWEVEFPVLVSEEPPSRERRVVQRAVVAALVAVP